MLPEIDDNYVGPIFDYIRSAEFDVSGLSKLELLQFLHENYPLFAIRAAKEKLTKNNGKICSYLIEQEKTEVLLDTFPHKNRLKLKWKSAPPNELSMQDLDLMMFSRVPNALGLNFGWPKYPEDSEVSIILRSGNLLLTPWVDPEASEQYNAVLKAIKLRNVDDVEFIVRRQGDFVSLGYTTHDEGFSTMRLEMSGKFVHRVSPQLMDVVMDTHVVPNASPETCRGIAEIVKSITSHDLP